MYVLYRERKEWIDYQDDKSLFFYYNTQTPKYMAGNEEVDYKKQILWWMVLATCKGSTCHVPTLGKWVRSMGCCIKYSKPGWEDALQVVG